MEYYIPFSDAPTVSKARLWFNVECTQADKLIRPESYRAYLEHVITKRFDRFSAKLTTEQQLNEHFQRTWDLIPQQDIDNLILSMNNRCQCVLNVRGGNTYY
ncbi:unnamed protein product [Parnassius mnemosyne]|uniref:Uncharacterized protein n=1 Tax=Parnassius mnemosyne TaxID=213953 RepID=A0AAV1L4P9_9NEOP